MKTIVKTPVNFPQKDNCQLVNQFYQQNTLMETNVLYFLTFSVI